ncbi:MAG: hypothetical protein L0H41_11610 [Microlunatus sp.]|nr:hypothetical protein [Microlunatus sp.]
MSRSAARRPGAARPDPALRSSQLGRLWSQLSTWVLAYLPDRSRRRRPAVRIHTSASVPGLVLRLIVVAIGFGCSAAVAGGPPSWVVIIALLVAIAIAPGTALPGVFVGVIGVLLLFDPAPSPVWLAPLLIAALPLMLQLAAIAGQVSMSAQVEVRVLALPARRYLVIQVFAQLLALVGMISASLGVVLPQLMAAAGAALLALVVVWLPSLGPPRRHDR